MCLRGNGYTFETYFRFDRVQRTMTRMRDARNETEMR